MPQKPAEETCILTFCKGCIHNNPRPIIPDEIQCPIQSFIEKELAPFIYSNNKTGEVWCYLFYDIDNIDGG